MYSKEEPTRRYYHIECNRKYFNYNTTLVNVDDSPIQTTSNDDERKTYLLSLNIVIQMYNESQYAMFDMLVQGWA